MNHGPVDLRSISRAGYSRQRAQSHLSQCLPSQVELVREHLKHKEALCHPWVVQEKLQNSWQAVHEVCTSHFEPDADTVGIWSVLAAIVAGERLSHPHHVAASYRALSGAQRNWNAVTGDSESR